MQANQMKKYFFLSVILSFFLSLSLYAEKKTICLNMIVKNEKDVITRCLHSVKPLIDYWVIVDTGSSDGTQEIIKEYMKDIPGELHERPWKNFEHNRNEALDLAQNKADYCLIMDADDFLEFDPQFILPQLNADGYSIRIQLGKTSFYRPQLISLHKPWRWIGVLHECLTSPPPCTIETLHHVHYKDTRDGARSKDPQKYAKDAQILEEALKNDPNNARYMFYLAQSYHDARQYEKAISCYETRIAMGGWEEEIYWSMLQVATIKQFLKYPTEMVLCDYFRAYRSRPYRAEALYHLCKILNENQEYALSYSLLTSHEYIPQPSVHDILFCQDWIEQYGLMFERSICSYYMGFFEESFDLCDTLLQQPELPPYLRQIVIQNKKFSEPKTQIHKTNSV